MNSNGNTPATSFGMAAFFIASGRRLEGVELIGSTPQFLFADAGEADAEAYNDTLKYLRNVVKVLEGGVGTTGTRRWLFRAEGK